VDNSRGRARAPGELATIIGTNVRRSKVALKPLASDDSDQDVFKAGSVVSEPDLLIRDQKVGGAQAN